MECDRSIEENLPNGNKAKKYQWPFTLKTDTHTHNFFRSSMDAIWPSYRNSIGQNLSTRKKRKKQKSRKKYCHCKLELNFYYDF